MLILVGVTVTVAINGGLFEKSKEATRKTLIEREKEELTSAIATAYNVETGKVDKTKLENALSGWKVEENGDGSYTVKSPKQNIYNVATNGTITKPSNISKGDFVEYNVAYTDVCNSNNKYTTTNGWRLLDYTDNGDGTYSNVKLISTGVPASLYYYYDDTTNNSWYVTDSSKLTDFKNVLGNDYALYTGSKTYYSLQAAAGMYYNFGDIKFAYGETKRGYSLGWFTEIITNGITYNSTNTIETTGSNLFIPQGVNASVRLLTLPEMNKMLGRTDIDSDDKMTDPTGMTGMFVLQNLKNLTGMNSYTYDEDNDVWLYWLASPRTIIGFSDNNEKMTLVGNDGVIFSTAKTWAGVRPVVSLTSNVKLTDNGNGVLKID